MILATSAVVGIAGAALRPGEGFTPPQRIAPTVLAGANVRLFAAPHAHGLEHEHRHDDEHHDRTYDGFAPGARNSHPPWPDLHHRHAHREIGRTAARPARKRYSPSVPAMPPPADPCRRPAARDGLHRIRVTLCLAGAALAAVALLWAMVRSGRASMPAPLAILTVNDEHPRMPAARFDHAAHSRHAVAAGRDACAGCHHRLRDAPAEIPRACPECHVPSWLAPVVDESKPHAHDQPPDL